MRQELVPGTRIIAPSIPYEKMPAHRLLAYYKKVRRYACRLACPCCHEILDARDRKIGRALWKELHQMKRILATKPHVEKKR